MQGQTDKWTDRQTDIIIWYSNRRDLQRGWVPLIEHDQGLKFLMVLHSVSTIVTGAFCSLKARLLHQVFWSAPQLSPFMPRDVFDTLAFSWGQEKFYSFSHIRNILSVKLYSICYFLCVFFLIPVAPGSQEIVYTAYLVCSLLDPDKYRYSICIQQVISLDIWAISCDIIRL